MTQTDQRPPLARLLRPRSLAIVGASPEPLSVGNNVLANLRRFGWSGELHLVSRSRSEIDGHPCVPTIDDLPMGVDALILIVPAQAVRDQIEACARRGVGGVVVFASGFGEQDEAGRTAQDVIAAIARASNMVVLGPNCIGSVNYADGVPLTFEPVEPAPTKGPGVCVVAQSGAMQGNIRYALQGRGVPVAHSISTGNEAVLSAEDYLDLLIDDPAISVFALFVEQIRRPQNFLRLARRARAAGKPIVLLHPGRSNRAREAAKSHTGALAGDHAVMCAFVERAGVVVVDGLDELFDTVTLLAHRPHPTPGGLAVVSNSGALRGFSLDFCEDLDLALPDLEASTVETLKAVLPPFAAIDNPLDITAAGMQKPILFGQTSQAMLDDPQVGFLLVIAMGGGKPQQFSKWQALRPVLEAATKPVALVYLGDDYPLNAEFMKEVAESGIPFFRSPDRALRALARVAAYANRLALPDEPMSTAGKPGAFATAERRPLSEWRSKKVLADRGTSVPAGGLAADLAEARLMAGNVGYPVAMKVQADALSHKSELGGVILNITDAARLDAAYDKLMHNLSIHAPNVKIDGVLVEKMAPRGGLEMIIGANRDPQWGPVLLIGLGGIWAEALNDVRIMPATASVEEIQRELRKLRGGSLLDGFRGGAPRDVAALAKVAADIGALIEADPRIVEIDVNPVNVYPQGEGALALDALIIMS
jgi:acyl-CoA synthetase (NDP forming)